MQPYFVISISNDSPSVEIHNTVYASHEDITAGTQNEVLRYEQCDAKADYCSFTWVTQELVC